MVSTETPDATERFSVRRVNPDEKERTLGA